MMRKTRNLSKIELLYKKCWKQRLRESVDILEVYHPQIMLGPTPLYYYMCGLGMGHGFEMCESTHLVYDATSFKPIPFSFNFGCREF